MKQTKASHRKISPGIETNKKQSLHLLFTSVNGHVVYPPQHGQCLGIGKTRIIVKIVRFFFFGFSATKGRSKPVILPPPRVWIGTRPDMQNPSDLPTRATRKTTRFSVRDAKYNAAGAMHRVAWALQNSKGTGQKCEKPWENQGFAAERTGFELLHVSPMIFG